MAVVVSKEGNLVKSSKCCNCTARSPLVGYVYTTAFRVDQGFIVKSYDYAIQDT